MRELGLALGIEEIDRKYEVLAKMGEGGMGEVYKVRHLLLDEVRVIKTIRAQYRADAELQARFLREARVSTQLRHPNIVTIHDFSVGPDGTACLVMELVEGENLAERMRAGWKPAPAEALEIARQTLEALAYLHQRQVVHRDISPDNVMVSRDPAGRPRAKLIDLGIAKPLEGADWQTRTAMFIGKVRYASPEQLSAGSDNLDGRSDLYSFSVMLYELLTGTLPVTGTDQASLIAGHLFQPPRRFEETDPQGRIPPGVREALLRGLAKRPEDRFPTAQSFAAALAGAPGAVAAPAAEAPTQLAPAQPVAAPAAGSRRRWLVAAGLALAAALGLTWFLTGPADEPPGTTDLLAGIEFGAYRALVVGNDNYQHLPRLETAARDAREVARLLEERYGVEVRLLLDADRYQLVSALSDLTAAAGPRDNLIVYYAGHSWLDRANDSGFWQPIDADPLDTSQWISARFEITALLDGSAARHVLVIADSCYAGSRDEATPLAPLPAPPEARAARVAELLPLRSRLSLTSGGQSPVLDAGDGRHSIFARALLDALADNDGLLDVATLTARVVPAVTQAAARLGVTQTPQLAPLPRSRDEGGGFFFVSARAPAAAPG